MHAPFPPPQFPWVTSNIPHSSTTVGKRQSQWPAKQPVIAVLAPPSVETPSFSFDRKSVYAVPSGGFALFVQLENGPLHQV